MATEEIRVGLKADVVSFEEGLNRAGISLNRFNNHLRSSFKEVAINKKGVEYLRKEFGVFDGAVKKIQRSTISASQANQQFTQSFQKQLDVMDVQPIGDFSQKLQEAGLSQKQWTKYAKDNFLEVKEGIGVYDKMTGQVMNYGTAIKQASIKTRRFKFEWFMWSVVMAPIMSLLTPILWKLIDAFMALPSGVQLVIGAFILFGAALGKVLSVGGQIILFYYALKGLGISIGLVFIKLGGVFKVLFTGILTGIKFVIANFLPIIAIIAGLALIVTGFYMVFKKKFEGIGLIIMGIGAILLLFIGWWALIPIAVGAAVFLIIKYWDNIKSFFSKLWGWIKDIFEKGWEWIKWIFFNINPVEIIIKNWEKIKDFFKELWESVKSIFSSAWDWIKNLFKKIKDAIEDLIPDWMIKIFKKGIGSISGSVSGWKNLLGFQAGGLVTKTGPAFLHAGERVIPKNRVNREGVIFSPTVYITASIDSEMDINILADKLNRQWSREFERVLQNRGST